MPSDQERTMLQQRVLMAAAYFLYIIGIAPLLYYEPNYWKQDYHSSVLSGAAWVNKSSLTWSKWPGLCGRYCWNIRSPRDIGTYRANGREAQASLYRRYR